MNKNRVRWIIVFVGLSAGIIGGLVGAAWTSPSVIAVDHIAAKRLTIVDESGQSVVILGVMGESKNNKHSVRGYLGILNLAGKTIATLYADKNGGALVVSDSTGKPIAALPMKERQ